MVNPGAQRLAVAALIFNAFVWGISWWPFRLLQGYGLHPLWATALMYWFATLCIVVYRPKAWRSLLGSPILWLLALAAGLTNIGFNWAVTIGDVVRVVLLFYLMPAWSVLLAWPVLGERPTGASLLRLSLALFGVLLVLKTPQNPWPLPSSLADYLALMGGLCFALTNILLRKLNQTSSSSRMMAMFGGGALTATALAVSGVHGGWVNALPSVNPGWLIPASVLAVLFLVGNLALQYGAARLRASTTALVMLCEIIFASLSSVALGASVLEPRLLWGAALIFLAAIHAAGSER